MPTIKLRCAYPDYKFTADVEYSGPPESVLHEVFRVLPQAKVAEADGRRWLRGETAFEEAVPSAVLEGLRLAAARCARVLSEVVPTAITYQPLSTAQADALRDARRLAQRAVDLDARPVGPKSGAAD